ncbi:carbohydrate ABC transporter membrane protein 1 (CUT1 family) [Variovorax sp. 54]|uniref:carbohydrate ABC transporter permease n=1 Tax=Variovorax sp. 54 TaxID=2035212 RepID=UPI000C6978EB|nr:sugar ABC transporter permease [Variovorax sp. 54]PIF73815.1 carbohydrate ABC transporter membrane protein 1 (CUT1 family) [Variovorax sp. 54]
MNAVTTTSTHREVQAAPRRGRLKRHERRVGIALALPALVAFCGVILYPFLQSLFMSLQRYTLSTPEPIFAGFENFRRLANEPGMWTVWLNTAVFVVVTTALTFVLALAWALIVQQKFRGRTFVRSASLLPWVLPSTVTAFLWAWLLNGQYGVLNAMLLSLHVIDEPITWLATEYGAMAGVIVAKAWLSVPLFMAFFLAGLQGVSQDQVDAARVDGCENIGVLRYVVLPHLAPTMVIITVLGAMGNLQAFDVIYAMTQGGPVKATTMLSIEVYKQAFQNWDMGLACAIGFVWFITIAVPAGFYLRMLFRREAA